ncbi:MAG: hypothetical protein ACM3QS_10830 [Bacteroidota bacterium]
MADHSVYLETDAAAVAQSPGFPYLRLSPVLIDTESPERFSAPAEELLLAMHLSDGKLLVISNKHISIYKVPSKKSFIQKATSVGLHVGVGLIPGVGELVDAAEKVSEAAVGTWNFASGKKRKQRKEDSLRAAEGMPTKKEIEDLVWDYRDRNTLALILLYQDRILLRNGFEWKTEFKAPLENTAGQPIEITADSKGIRFAAGRQKTFTQYAAKDWAPLKITAALIEMNGPALEAAGWVVESSDQKITLKKSQ